MHRAWSLPRFPVPTNAVPSTCGYTESLISQSQSQLKIHFPTCACTCQARNSHKWLTDNVWESTQITEGFHHFREFYGQRHPRPTRLSHSASSQGCLYNSPSEVYLLPTLSVKLFSVISSWTLCSRPVLRFSEFNCIIFKNLAYMLAHPHNFWGKQSV